MKIAFRRLTPFEKQLPSPKTNIILCVVKNNEGIKFDNENCKEQDLCYLKSNFLHLLLILSLFRSLANVLYNIRHLYTNCIHFLNIPLNRSIKTMHYDRYNHAI